MKKDVLKPETDRKNDTDEDGIGSFDPESVEHAKKKDA